MHDLSTEAIRAARQDLDAVIEDIRAVPEHEDFLAAPTFADVAHAASDQPLVYVAAADLGGLALVVRGEDVTHVPLRRLTADAVQAEIGGYVDAYAAFQADHDGAVRGWQRVLADTTRWLWDEVMGPVLDKVKGAPELVMMPGGLLGLLPMHAAWTEDTTTATGRRHALDVTTISYAPNARSLAAARALAARPVERLLAVPDPTPASEPDALAFAGAEVAMAQALFPGSTLVLPDHEATVERVADELQTADVVHLACHGRAELTAPLESGLRLAGGRMLRLRDLMGLRLRLRLAVLSACETSLPGTELPDEVVALPTGLLQAGVGGVVASQWAVPDIPTVVLMTAFYRAWLVDKMPPAAALRSAQRWVRDTPHEQLLAWYGNALDSEQPWLPADAGATVLMGLYGIEAAEWDEAQLDRWAGFGYVGA